MQAAAPNPSPLVPDAPAEAPTPERPVAVENPAARPEPPSRPLKRRRIASASPRRRLRRRPRPLPNRLLRQLRIYPFRLASPRKLNLRPRRPAAGGDADRFAELARVGEASRRPV
jgi:hypothetical protein